MTRPVGDADTQRATNTRASSGAIGHAFLITNQLTTDERDLVIVPGPSNGDIHLSRPADGTGVCYVDLPLKIDTGQTFSLRNDSNTELLVVTQVGEVTFADHAVFPSGKGVKLSMRAGSTAQVVGDSSNRLNIRPGSGGTRFLDSAFAAVNLSVSDDGDVELHRGDLVLRSPNGTRYRLTVGDDGTLSTTAA